MSIYNAGLDDYFCELPECMEPIPYCQESGARMGGSERKQRKFCGMKCAGINRSRLCNRGGPKRTVKRLEVKTRAEIVCDNWLYGVA